MKDLQEASSKIPTDSNHLKNELSPYLLQHADNPVHWYPWGDAAFKKAKDQDKPIFLSIGYSTCHWCHVMEHESFENKEIAKVLNDHFVSIKVDREERGDIDQVYMNVVMSLTGSGGWPLNVFLTPEKKPFYGGTYFSPKSQWGKPGFLELLNLIADKWEAERTQIIQSSNEITQSLQENIQKEPTRSSALTIDIFSTAYKNFLNTYDQHYGGFGNAPKFPSSHNLSFLLRYWKRSKEVPALDMVTNTLIKMAQGGIYDHLGGGFHRYATDRKWHVPHFEKMLYDQATTTKAYLEAYQATGNDVFAQVVGETFDYVLRDMTDREGGFYSAEDADSIPVDSSDSQEKKEGAFYVWKKEEVDQTLEKKDAEIFAYVYGLKNNGNVTEDPHGEFKGENIIAVARATQEIQDRFDLEVGEIKSSLDRSKRLLFDLRKKRSKPHLDDKILVDWNGLMISSLAIGSRVLEEPRYLEVAEKAAGFILKKLVRRDGRLLHRYRQGHAAILGSLDDYAFFIQGLIDLYEATFKTEYLIQANQLAEDMIKLFEDKEHGGFFFSGRDAEELLFKDKALFDGAMSSGNAVAAMNLVRLWRFTFNDQWEKYLKLFFDGFSGDIARAPNSYAQTLMAFDFLLGPSKEIVIAEGRDSVEIQEMVQLIFKKFIPNKIVIFRSFNENAAKEIISINPFVENQTAIDEKATIYVCEDYVCKYPATSIEELDLLLK